MKRNPAPEAKKPEGWLATRVQLLVKHRVEVLQIVLALIFFLLSVGSLQYLPMLTVWFHISDMTLGKVMVYSLPFWIALAFFLIWRS
jgi:hypothetical protein